MKKSMLLLLLIFTPLGLWAQEDYNPMIVEGRNWYYQVWEPMTGKEFYSYTIVGGDTIVDGRSCKKILYEGDGEKKVLGFAYDQGRKVYAKQYVGDEVIDQTLGWDVLYDFELNIGDKFRGFYLCNSDKVEVDGREYRRLYLDEKKEAANCRVVWVEGIGSCWGLESPFGYATSTVYTFLRCNENGEVIFSAEDFNQPSTTGIQNKIVNSQLSNGKCFDLQGREVQSNKVIKSQGNLPKGIYIVNGKRVVVR